MDSVIIAAGLGQRLRELSESKPLTKVCGLALLEIALRQLALAGVARAVVVTGHKASEVEAELPAFAKAAGIAVEPARVDDWTLANGHSVIAGASKVEGNYLLVMADHILSAGILRKLLTGGPQDCGVTLAIDRKMDNPRIDPLDATYVRVDQNGWIQAIGKGLERPDAVDCGAFLATPELAGAISEAIAQGRPGNLSDGMQLLADRRRAATLDIGNEWWLDVDEPVYHAMAEREVPQYLQHLVTVVS